MPVDEPPDYSKMQWNRVARLAEAGESGAQSVLADFGSFLEQAGSHLTASLDGLYEPYEVDTEATRVAFAEMAQRKAQKEREAVEREVAMLRELAEMRERAEASERRGRFMARVAVVGVLVGAVGSVAAVVAIF